MRARHRGLIIKAPHTLTIVSSVALATAAIAFSVSGARHSGTVQAAESPAAEAINFGFEKGMDGWSERGSVPMSTALGEAAHGGKLGLRVEDTDAAQGSSVFSPQMAVSANSTYRLGFWARTSVKSGGGVWVRFYDADRKTLGTAATVVAALQKADGTWTQYQSTVRAPDKAAFLGFWIHTNTAALGTFDFDDFTAVSDGAAAPAGVVGGTAPTKTGGSTVAAANTGAATAVQAVNSGGELSPAMPLPAPVARKKPAYIVLKVDDLISAGTGATAGVDPLWQKFVDFIKARHIKASIGIIANSLEGEKPGYFRWIKEQQATGLFEFWNHGYDHKQWVEGGKTIEEFRGASYEQQKDHLVRSNLLAREKLGFPFRSFGAPFNATDGNTVKVLEADTDIQTWMFGELKTPAGKVVLDRVPQVNIEVQTFVPNALKFAQNYNRLPERDFFVIQGHPSHWTGERFDEFVRIVDFLTKAGAIFVTPSEYAALQKSAG